MDWDTLSAILIALFFIAAFIGMPALSVYLFLKSPARKAMRMAKAHSQMLAALASGDVVMLTTGRSGTILKAMRDELEIALDDGETFTVNKALVAAKR